MVECPCGYAGTILQVNAHRGHHKTDACNGPVRPLTAAEVAAAEIDESTPPTPPDEDGGRGPAGDTFPAGAARTTPPPTRTVPPAPSGSGSVPNPKGAGPLLPDPPTAKITLDLSVRTWAYYDVARSQFGYDKSFGMFVEECIDDLFLMLGWGGIALVPRDARGVTSATA